MGKTWIAIVLAGAFVLPPPAWGQSRGRATPGEHWVTTWATAQPLAPASSMFGPGRSGPGAPGPQAPAPTATAPAAGAPQPGRGQPGRAGRGPAPLPASFM